MFPDTWVFNISGAINTFVDWLLDSFAPFFDTLSHIVLTLLLRIHNILDGTPWWIIILLIAVFAWFTSKKVYIVLVLSGLPFFIGLMGLWVLAVETLAIVFTAVVIALIIGIPMGIIMAESNFVQTTLQPVLDAMQTMPSFVYLIPAMMLFGLGKVPGVLATFIYAVPPVIRLTNLGLRQVPTEVEEATYAYGATRWQLLKETRLPLAMPSIMAGINQTTMMALSMVVIASMIGAGGLGYEVLVSINRIDVGRGFEAGISVVFLAIVIDRLTQGFARRFEPPQA